MNWLARFESTFLFLAIVLYLGALVGYWWRVLWGAPDQDNDESDAPNTVAKNAADKDNVPLMRICRALLWAGALFHLLALLGQGGTLLEVRSGAAGLFAWVLLLAYLIFGRWGRGTLGALVLPVILLSTLFSLVAPPLHRSASAAQLERDWLLVHLSIILLSYVSLTFAFGASFIYLWQEKLLKRKQLRGIWQKLPSLQTADEWIFRATCFGTAMLSLGIGTGMFWLRLHPEYQILRDPKVLFTTATWSIFAIYLLTRWLWGWQGRRSRYIVVGGFILMVVSFLGTPHLLSGIGR